MNILKIYYIYVLLCLLTNCTILVIILHDNVKYFYALLLLDISSFVILFMITYIFSELYTEFISDIPHRTNNNESNKIYIIVINPDDSLNIINK